MVTRERGQRTGGHGKGLERPHMGGTRVALQEGGTKVTCGWHWGHVGATKCG